MESNPDSWPRGPLSISAASGSSQPPSPPPQSFRTLELRGSWRRSIAAVTDSVAHAALDAAMSMGTSGGQSFRGRHHPSVTFRGEVKLTLEKKRPASAGLRTRTVGRARLQQ